MAGCKCENWTLQELASALRGIYTNTTDNNANATNTEKKRIVVPMFQRGKRWKKAQEEKFIDSLVKGYPVGTMLFYRTVDGDVETYILVDGLQRGNSIKKYMTNPSEFFYDDSISDEFCSSVLKILDKDNEKNLYDKIRTLIINFIKAQNKFKNLQYYEVAKQISDEFSDDGSCIGQFITVINDFFEERQNLYDRIANTVIPVIVYTGDESNLSDIFDRINSQGTPLDPYEVYAAAWPGKKKFKISNKDIVEHVINKYDAFEDDDFKIYGYDREKMRSDKEVNAFEYLFGLSKHLVQKYDILAFSSNTANDTVNPLAFELVNACLNDTDRIKKLYEDLYAIDVNVFETALYKAIEFVRDALKVITQFKGNSRKFKKLFHTKYQIISMISTTFKEMYTGTDYTHFAANWDASKKVIANNLKQYYVYDIINDYWGNGGNNKVHTAAKPNRYAINISSRAWMSALDSFFERSMQRSERKNVNNPRSGEYVILNCIYLKTFTAMDQLSLEKFDVEHIAPKEQMKKLIEACAGDGLPISCIANLCYLPEQVNRSKGAKNFYQDKKYLEHIDLAKVENKYSFTDKDDLEWMDMPYENPEDFQVLKEYYTEYCAKRFEKMKYLFFSALGIEYEDDTEPELELEDTSVENEVIIPSSSKPSSKKTDFSSKCVLRLANTEGHELVKVGRRAYTTTDSKKGFIIVISKEYEQGSRKKYWFAYRNKPLEDIEQCEEQYVVYGCKDESTMLCIPTAVIKERLDRLITSTSDGEIDHWHIVFFKDDGGKITWLLSKPEIEEVEITDFLL